MQREHPTNHAAHTAGKEFNIVPAPKIDTLAGPCRLCTVGRASCGVRRRQKFLLLGHVLVEHFIRLTLTRKGNAQRSKPALCWFRNATAEWIQDDFASIGRVVIAFAAREHVKLVSADLPFRSRWWWKMLVVPS
jgi:hypothetical protein